MNLLTPKKTDPQAGVRYEETHEGLNVYLAAGIEADFLMEGLGANPKTCFFLEKNARVEVFALAFGGDDLPHSVEAELKGQDAYFSFKGLGVLSDSENRRFKVTARHQAPGTVSRQLYKSILTETAFSEFETVVSVQKDAPRSDSHQLCRNLLLSEGARAVSRPILNIDNDDVACAHGATTGPMEESEIFYLRSRGLTEAAAKELMVYGFAQEVVEAVADKPLRKRLESLVRAKIGQILKTRG